MLTQFSFYGMLLLQQEVGFDMVSMWNQMGFAARAVVIIMFLMSAWSIGVMIDRYIAFNGAKKSSKDFAPAVAGALRDGNLADAIKLADRHKKSHLAKVVVAGLKEYSAAEGSIESSEAALDRSHAIVSAALKRGLGGLATIGSTAPFVGLFGTVIGIINAFQGISAEKSTGLGAVAGGISEALVATAIGLFVAIPAVWMFNHFNEKVQGFTVEMNNASSELLDYFSKKAAG